MYYKKIIYTCFCIFKIIRNIYESNFILFSVENETKEFFKTKI